MPESVLTTYEVAALLELNVKTVYARITMQRLLAAKMSRRWRLKEARVRAWVETCDSHAVHHVDPVTHSTAEGS